MTAVRYNDVDVAEVVAGALEFAAQKTGLQDEARVRQALQEGQCAVCEYVRSGLAQRVAACLGAADDAVRAVYVYDPERATGEEETVNSPAINLIVWARRRTAALDALIAMLGLALREERKGLVCPHAQALCAQLDVQVADDEQVRSHSGYGALLASLYVRPAEVWRRE